MPNSDHSSKNEKPQFIKNELAMLHSGLSRAANDLYGILRLHAGQDGKCCPKRATLARELEVTERHIGRLLGELKEAGRIESTRGRRFSCYRLLDGSNGDRTKMSSHKTVPSDGEGTKMSSHKGTKMSYHRGRYKEGKEVPEKKNTSAAAAVLARDARENSAAAAPLRGENPAPAPAALTLRRMMFEDLKAIYPGFFDGYKAEKQWRRLTADEQDRAVWWVKTYGDCKQWLVEDRRFVPAASRFLEEKRFNWPPPEAIERKRPAAAERDQFDLTLAMMNHYQKLGGKR